MASLSPAQLKLFDAAECGDKERVLELVQEIRSNEGNSCPNDSVCELYVTVIKLRAHQNFSLIVLPFTMLLKYVLGLQFLRIEQLNRFE